MQTDLINLNEASTLQPPGVFRRNVTQKLDLERMCTKMQKGWKQMRIARGDPTEGFYLEL